MTKEELIQVFEDTQRLIMENKTLQKQTSYMKNNSQLYLDHYEVVDKKVQSPITNISLEDNSTFHCASQYAKNNKFAVLNFASSIHYGGGVKKGSSAQEESLCRCSNLYNGLKNPYLVRHYYEYNQYHRSATGSDSVIYTPSVTVFKEDGTYRLLDESDWFQVDVLTCAAPDLRHAELSDQKQFDIHYTRGKNILEVAIANHADILILGAFGCGAFRNTPEVVANAYKKLLIGEHYAAYFKQVIFAIPDGKNMNYSIFNSVFHTVSQMNFKDEFICDMKDFVTGHFGRKFNEKEMNRLLKGHMAISTEDRWCWFTENNTVYFIRSWNGRVIYRLHLNAIDNIYSFDTSYDNDRDVSKALSKGPKDFIDLLSFAVSGYYDQYYNKFVDSPKKSTIEII